MQNCNWSDVGGPCILGHGPECDRCYRSPTALALAAAYAAKGEELPAGTAREEAINAAARRGTPR